MRQDKRARQPRGGRLVWLPALMLMLCVRAGAQTAVQQSAGSAPPVVRAAAAIVVDAQTGATLFAKNPDRRLPPASTTKIMTALILAQRVPPDQRIAASPAAAATPGLALGMRPGESFTCRDLLHAVMLASANDAAIAAAEYIAGTEARFAAQMNAEAQAMGAANTHFTNPSGLPDPNHYSTARDLAAIACQAVRNPLFDAVARTRTYRVPRGDGRPPTLLTNKDELLWSFPGADGIKTGYTQDAGYCFVGSATRNGRRLITVVLHSPDWQGETAALLRYGFSRAATNSDAHPVASALSRADKRPGSDLTPSGSPFPKPVAALPGKGESENPAPVLPSPYEGEGPGVRSLPSPTLGGREGMKGLLPFPLGRGLGGRSRDVGPKATQRRALARRKQPKAQNGLLPPDDWAKRPQSADWPRFTPTPPPAPKKPWRWLGFLLLFLLACLLLRQWARLRGITMSLPRLFALFRRRSEQQPAETRTRPDLHSEVPSVSAPMPASDFVFTMPPIARCSGPDWLRQVADAPTRLLETAVRRQAAAVVDTYPDEARESLGSLLDSGNVKVRIAAAELLAGIAPRRAEETLLAALDDDSAGPEACAEAIHHLARLNGDRHEALFTQSLLRDGSAQAARALMDLSNLDEKTRHSLQRVMTAERPPSGGSATAQKVAFQAALAACVLGAHGLLSPEETAAALKQVDAAKQEPILSSCLRGRSEPWAVDALAEAALRPHGYAALQALLDADPGSVRAALDAREEGLEITERTRAKTLKWLLLGEGDAEAIRRLADSGDDLASGALKLERLHRWDLNEASPDALCAAAVIASLRLGFSAHTPEQIAAALRAGAGGEETAESLAQTPELEPLSRAYAEPAVYDAVQAAMHTDDGLSALLAALARRPENRATQEELAFWADKIPSETRLLLTHALRGAQSDTACAALSARTGDPCPSVRAAALRLCPAAPMRVERPAASDAVPSVPPDALELLAAELMDRAA